MISVLLPVFNGAGYLDACVAAVLAQSERDLELVVVDDASSDDTFQVASGWAHRDDRVRVHRLAANTRKNGAYRKAIALARGEWLIEVNADDLLLPHALEVLLTAAQANPTAAAVFANHDVIDEAGCLDARMSKAADDHSGRDRLDAGFVDRIIDRQLIQNVLTTSVCALVKSETLRDFPTFTDSMTDYWASWLIARRGDVYYVDEVLAHYRKHAGSESTSRSYYSRAQSRSRLRMYFAILPSLRSPRVAAFMLWRVIRTLVLFATNGTYFPRPPRRL